MTKIVEVKDSASAVVGLDSNGSIRMHLTNEGENMETDTCGCGGMDVMAGGCCRRPEPVESVGELYKSLKSNIQSAKERLARKPDWNIKKKDKK